MFTDRREASLDMQHELLGSSCGFDLGSDFDLDLSRSPCICFDASRREKMMALDYYPRFLC